MSRNPAIMVVACLMAIASVASSQDLPPGEGFAIQVLVEREVAELPEGSLFWRVETFDTAEAAEAAAGPWGLVAEAADRVWLFTLGAEGGSSPDGTLMAEIGPMAEVAAPQYLLRVNEARAVPGGSTIRHTHPGTEAIYVLDGDLTMRTPDEMLQVAAGQSQPGHAPGTIMQVSNEASTDMHALVMFIVDPAHPFSSPAANLPHDTLTTGGRALQMLSLEQEQRDLRREFMEATRAQQGAEAQETAGDVP